MGHVKDVQEGRICIARFSVGHMTITFMIKLFGTKMTVAVNILITCEERGMS
jgi:hypothetical protein